MKFSFLKFDFKPTKVIKHSPRSANISLVSVLQITAERTKSFVEGVRFTAFIKDTHIFGLLRYSQGIL